MVVYDDTDERDRDADHGEPDEFGKRESDHCDDQPDDQKGNY